MGENIDASSIAALGNQITGLSTGQLMMMKPSDVIKALGMLGGVNGWNQGQANAIIQMLLSSGMKVDVLHSSSRSLYLNRAC